MFICNYRVNLTVMYLSSPVLRLRAPELADLDFLFHIENDTRQWMVSSCKVPYSRYLLQQYIETNSHELYIDKQARMMIEHVDTGQLLGAIDLFDFSPANRRAEVGIVIDKACRGKGYGHEALTVLCDYAEHVLGLHQLYAYVLEDNDPARRLFASCGFIHVVTLSDWVFSDKKYRPVYLYQCILEK